LAVGALALGVVFLLVSGGDLATTRRYKGVQAANGPPDSIQEGVLRSRVAAFETARLCCVLPLARCSLAAAAALVALACCALLARALSCCR
jgi:hypothetical protein